MKFIQFHMLTSYPSALLNRDEAGFQKRVEFGGYTRLRISSQCQKHHWKDNFNIDLPLSIRSRKIFDEYIYKPLSENFDPKKIAAALDALIEILSGKSEKKKKEKKDEEKAVSFELPQMVVYGESEINYFITLIIQAVEKANTPEEAHTNIISLNKFEFKKNIESLKLGAGLDAALFGRMVTGDILANTDAAVHVAHAMTVHSETVESDYFTAVDDLQKKEEHGGAHINTAELASGLYYSYIVIDLDQLILNIEGCPRSQISKADHTTAAEVITHLLNIITTVSPGAKKGSTAPYAYAHFLMIEAGNAQPRTLSNAFIKPIKGNDLLGETYNQFFSYLDDIDGMYGKPEKRKLTGVRLPQNIKKDGSIQELSNWLKKEITKG